MSSWVRLAAIVGLFFCALARAPWYVSLAIFIIGIVPISEDSDGE